MRFLVILIAAFALSACSFQGMIEKSVPENVRKDHAAHIDKLLARDTSRMERAFGLDMENEDTQKRIALILDNVPEGNEIRRDYVGFTSSSGISTSEGKSREISLTTEVQTDDGFMTVAANYALDSKGECCALTNMNVTEYESSPLRTGLEAAAKVGKILGLVFLGIIIFIVGLIVLMTRRKRRRREALTLDR